MELEVVWNGSHKDTYLCIPPLHFGDLSHLQPMVIDDDPPTRVMRPYRDRTEMRQQILAILRRRRSMTIKALRAELGRPDAQFYNLVTRMTMQGMLERPATGVVRLAVGALPRRAEERA